MSSWSIRRGSPLISWPINWPAAGHGCMRSRRPFGGRRICVLATPTDRTWKSRSGTTDPTRLRPWCKGSSPACIIPCTEHALYWLWNQPDHIQERCLPNVAPAIRPLLLDRALLLEAAAGWGVATPTAMPLNSHDDCRAAIAAGLPLVVKSGQSIGGHGVALCRISDDVIRAFDEFFSRAASVTAQRYYVGPTYLAGALFVHGEAVHFYVGEKTVMWPPLTGRAYELRSAGEPHFSALLQSAETVCKNLEWTGLASFDFVLDEDGQFRFVDFNPRQWGSVDATLTAEVDLYGGVDRWIRCGNAGAPTRSIPGISHRVFPVYTLEPSDMSLWRRLMGLRDAPRGAVSFVAGELARELDERVRRAVSASKPRKTAKPAPSQPPRN